jgi:ribose transport system substrate-binding protein
MLDSTFVRRCLISAVGLLCCSLSTCSASRSPVVAVVPETTAQELWETEHAGAERGARVYGMSVYWNGPSREDDITRQIQIVNNMVARRAAGLILSPDHSVALISPVQAALAAGIPTVVVGSRLGIEPSNKLAYIVNDDETMGKMAAKRLQPHLKAGDTVAILGVNPAILSLVQRANAIESSLRTLAPGIKIVERHSTSFGFDEAEQIAEKTILETPHLRAIVTLDINETRAAYFARLNSAVGTRIVLIGCDQDLDLVRLVRTGEIDALIAEDTSTMGFEAMKEIARLRNSEAVEPERQIAPTLITRDNVDDPVIQNVLDMDWRMQ